MTQFTDQQRRELRAALEENDKLERQQAELEKVGLGDIDLKNALARNKARLNVLLTLEDI
jgi:hypothetical protein